MKNSSEASILKKTKLMENEIVFQSNHSKEEIKKYTLTSELAKRNINVINNKIADCLRLLRLSPNTRRDYTDKILFELKIIE